MGLQRPCSLFVKSFYYLSDILPLSACFNLEKHLRDMQALIKEQVWETSLLRSHNVHRCEINGSFTVGH